MKHRFILFRRGGVFYCEDTSNRKQVSLRTKDEGEAQTLLSAKNEAARQPILNLQIARTYLTATDPEIALRTWQAVMDEMTRDKTGSTLIRYQRAMADHAFDRIRDRPILETQSLELLKAMRAGTVATNVFLRRIHNFAIGMGWLPWPAGCVGLLRLWVVAPCLPFHRLAATCRNHVVFDMDCGLTGDSTGAGAPLTRQFMFT
ncbi:MAG: hypothetical protein LV480_11345 [Methylacidiphilales bacterium]|nr:hypothetical protein [Candidatus Methylacidiphilales bacterium]